MNKITIWNMALGFLGTRTVSAEDERTMEAVQCALYWDSARRQTLRDFPYNFAQRRMFPPAVAKPEGYEEWAHAYALPENCLKVHAVRQAGAGNHSPQRGAKAFALAADSEGTVLLLTNAQPALLLYSADVQDVSRYDDSFAYMLARKLAALAAVALLKNNSAKVQELETLYRESLTAAMCSAASEARDADTPDAWLCAR